MVGDQTANQAAKPLKREKTTTTKITSSGTVELLCCSDVTPLASSPVCLCFLGRFGALLWQPE
jgi:hypothetical protein